MEKTTPKSEKEKLVYLSKRILLIILIFSPIILFFGGSYVIIETSSNEYKPWVSWFDNPNETVYISWKTEEKTKGTVYYGIDKDDFSDNVKESDEENIHFIILTNLKADTKYYYEIKIDGDVFGSGMFRTAPNGYKSFTFGMISDTQQNVGLGHHPKVAETIKNKKWEFIANVGDIVDEGDEEPYYNNYFQVAAKYLNSIPLVPISGNHDEHEPSLFMDHFINNKYTSKKQFFYSFNWSSVHFQICDFPYGREDEMTDVQLNWMKEDLARAQDMPFRIVMFHCPIIGSSFFGWSEQLNKKVLPILENYKVDLVVHGHEHHYERGYINENLMYIILGGGGGQLDPGLRPLPETEVLVAMPSYSEVHVSENTLHIQTFSLQNELIDEVTLED
ncbi:MAG: metallophosphoesterase [Promethearchaeota archaeon]